MVLGFDGAIIRHLPIFLRRANTCKVSLFATLEAFPSFAILLLLLVVRCFTYHRRSVHGILVARGKARTRRLEIASSSVLLEVPSSLFLFWATPVEIAERVAPLLSLIGPGGGVTTRTTFALPSSFSYVYYMTCIS